MAKYTLNVSDFAPTAQDYIDEVMPFSACGFCESPPSVGSASALTGYNDPDMTEDETSLHE